MPRKLDPHRPRRRPLSTLERAALAKLAANLGPCIAARTVGLGPQAFRTAMRGCDVNPTTASQLRESHWFRSALKEVTPP